MYMTKRQLCDELNIGDTTVTQRVAEMEKSGRYAGKDLIRDGRLLWVDWYAFVDWLTVRKQLKTQPVPPYDRRRAERETPAPGRIHDEK